MGYTYSLTTTDVAESARRRHGQYPAVREGHRLTGEYDYDSEKDKEPPGAKMPMKMTPTGKVTDVHD
jgi:hypothetical protein